MNFVLFTKKKECLQKEIKSLSEKKKGSIPPVEYLIKKKSFKGYGRIFEKKNAGLCVCL